MYGVPSNEAVNEPHVVGRDSNPVLGAEDENEVDVEFESAVGCTVSLEYDEMTRVLIQSIKDCKLDTVEERENFLCRWSPHLARRHPDKSTPLHELASLPNFSKIPENMQFLRLLCRKLPDLMKATDAHTHGGTPLHMAVCCRNFDFVQITCGSLEDADDVIAIVDDEHETCLHVAIRLGSPLRMTLELLRHTRKETICIQDVHGRTALHIAVDYSLCTESQLGLVTELITKSDEALLLPTTKGMSAIQYHLHTREIYRAKSPENEENLASDWNSEKCSRGKVTQGSGARITNELVLAYLRWSLRKSKWERSASHP
jgi:hypothetical protein